MIESLPTSPEQADRIAQERRLAEIEASQERSTKFDPSKFAEHALRVSRIASADRLFDGTESKREALKASNLSVIYGRTDPETGRPAVIALQDASPYQIGQVYKKYYRSLQRSRRPKGKLN